jgi:phage shock protein PspC (stress-responsive transcriptional regulator)
VLVVVVVRVRALAGHVVCDYIIAFISIPNSTYYNTNKKETYLEQSTPSS